MPFYFLKTKKYRQNLYRACFIIYFYQYVIVILNRIERGQGEGFRKSFPLKV